MSTTTSSKSRRWCRPKKTSRAMYYHCRELKYVEYGKVFPPPDEACDEVIFPAYEWLGHYCGYCPQVWLSRCNIGMTGFRNQWARKNDGILFGFDVVKGFELNYELWHFVMGTAWAFPDATPEEVSQMVFAAVRDVDRSGRRDPDHVPLTGGADTVEAFLEKAVFRSRDHLVVPNLNLKSAKKIICRNERQKKKLRRKGFIEDRIMVKNVSYYDWM